jgi:hypothetical protein
VPNVARSHTAPAERHRFSGSTRTSSRFSTGGSEQKHQGRHRLGRRISKSCLSTDQGERDLVLVGKHEPELPVSNRRLLREFFKPNNEERLYQMLHCDF